MEKVVRIYNSFEEQEKAETEFRSKQTIAERLKEFGILQKRVFGDQWGDSPIKKTVKLEKLDWYKKK